VLPVDEYRERLNTRQSHADRCEKIHIRLGNFRLLLAITTVVLAWESVIRHALSPWWLAFPITVFAATAVYHSRILRAQKLADRAVSFYGRGLGRIEDRWAGKGQSGEQFNDPHHEYAADLDLFGKGGLFELLSTARTRMGEETLAKWLLSPARIHQVRWRHEAVCDLRDKLDFREDLAVLGSDTGAVVHPEALLNWAESANRVKPQWVQWLAFALAILAIADAFIWVTYGGSTLFILTLLVEACVMYLFRKSVTDVLAGSERAFYNLSLLAGTLARIESQRFTSAYLQTLQADLMSAAVPASRSMARLSKIVNWSESRRNLIVRILDVPLMYSLQVAFVAERWRRLHGSAVRSWLQVVGELEALISIATYSYEHPADPFPEFLSGAASLEGKEIGHPLIPHAICVRNDVALSEDVRVLLISGSNMSGKSTLLRAVGVNLVLAMAGAPVRATTFRMTPLQVGASIRINDSLQDGSSRFYAEITRLRKLFDLAGNDLAVLFLLDELLQGTNSQDRLVGAEGVISALLKRGAIGLASTHDLALTQMDGRIGGQLANFHFQEEFEDGRMHFDYKLHEGVVTKSNGLALMRSIGLDV
jgi:hypothetical protein